MRFVKNLKRKGFFRLQYSVFTRPCPSDEQAQRHADEVSSFVPPDGEVRMILLTDLQFGRQRIIQGEIAKKAEEPPPQLQLF